jgi:pyruvate/2-oxoglutarate/acetoin dehydrogenase E1 component/TPP-dependent pyruvate/acetoin dehydrogenase alpha subunit
LRPKQSQARRSRARSSGKKGGPIPPEEITPDEALRDYRLAFRSRRISIVGRNEVISGRAQFGIFGDGKELPQVAAARAMRPGDWRAGYYRDQTWMLALSSTTPRQIFAQLYGDTDVGREPSSGGRNVVNISATRLLDESGMWLSQLDAVNSAAGYGAVATQMAGALGLAYASKLYRMNQGMAQVSEPFSRDGGEVTFASIGNGSAAEGIFFEVLNAAAVLAVPLVVSVWDDGYAISVPNDLAMAHGSVSRALRGMEWDGTTGIGIYVVPGWDYQALRTAYATAAEQARSDHRPALVHVTDLTQPLGHSTSGSHEKYKSRERLAWEAEFDCLTVMRSWLIEFGLASESALDELENSEIDFVNSERDWARSASRRPLEELSARAERLTTIVNGSGPAQREDAELSRRATQHAISLATLGARGRHDGALADLDAFRRDAQRAGERVYRSHLFSESADSPLRVDSRLPQYDDRAEMVDGRSILVRFFDAALARDPKIFVIGEDVGRLGDVNLVYEGLQNRYGDTRVTDTGIREATILGQGIGCALRGLRPIVDIQYLDYFLFALEIASDDLATLHYRTAGGQKAPVVIRTKGHRLVGITHSGSPMSLLLSSCRGIYICVPRDMTRAAGMYGTLLKGDNPGLVIEVLNAYWMKERVPNNLDDLTIPLGVPEVLREGTDLTVVTYGAMCRLVMEAAQSLSQIGIELEVIDVQTLSPFDVNHSIARSVQKTGAVVFADEDVPGGASAFMMREVLEVQGAYEFLDAPPRTLSSAESRPAYGIDGDYFSKPNPDEIVRAAYAIVRERRPDTFPSLMAGPES